MALAFLAVLTQCKKEQVAPVSDSDAVPITLDIKTDGNTRVDVNTGTGAVTYQNGDMVYVASGGKYVGTLTHNGTRFAGTITNPVVGEPLHFYFLGNVTPAEALTAGTTQTCSVVISDQTQRMPVIEYAPSDQNYTDGSGNFTATLLNKCALVKFNVTTSSTAATCITGFNNKVTVNFSDNTLTNSQEGNGIITLPAGNGEKWAILLPQGALEAGVEGSAYSVDGVYSGTRGAVPAIPNNGYLTAGIEVAISTVNNYVDLGLPSGTLWATFNVGATTPEGYGDCFAWGETEPKDAYTLDNYQHCMGTEYTYTKYCNNSYFGYNGFTDNLTTLLPGDDAATANWGSGWRMPTQAEFHELIDNTTNTWTTQNGVNGWLFTANGNSLFLPAAGYSVDGSHSEYGGEGNYWSSSLNTGDDGPGNAWGLFFQSDWNDCYVEIGARDYGLSVRPVYVGSQNTSFNVDATANPTVGGNVTGAGSYTQGASCTLTATANTGYTFSNWTENGVVVSTSATYTFTVNANRTLVANFDHAYVDLGLPSGTLWATCNVGTTTPEGYGYYFAWGETTPYTAGNYTYSDNPATLPSDHDAATANWGSGWRIPTKEQWEELCQNTTVTWAEPNGVGGWLFKAKATANDNSIFLPAAGYHGESGPDNEGFDGYYWSSSLYTEDQTNAWALHFSYEGHEMFGDYRDYGNSVRPVRSGSQN